MVATQAPVHVIPWVRTAWNAAIRENLFKDPQAFESMKEIVKARGELQITKAGRTANNEGGWNKSQAPYVIHTVRLATNTPLFGQQRMHMQSKGRKGRREGAGKELLTALAPAAEAAALAADAAPVKFHPSTKD